MPEAPFEEEKPAHKASFTLFGKKKEEIAGPDVGGMLDRVNELARRVRIIESRYSDLNRKVQVTERNMLNDRKKFSKEFKTFDVDILELKRTLNQLQSKMDSIVSELANFAVKEDIDSLRKYVEMWEPINFVTRHEVETIVKEIIEENK